jgi:hypothetical protein
MTRPGVRGMPAGLLEGLAVDPAELAGAECKPEQLDLERVMRKAVAAADRIRAQVAAAICRCEIPPESVDVQGRCSRCLGRRT